MVGIDRLELRGERLLGLGTFAVKLLFELRELLFALLDEAVLLRVRCVELIASLPRT